MVTVTATDPNGLSASIDVTIKVTGVDEAPKIIVGGLVVTGTGDIDYAENGMGMVATYSAAGPDAAERYLEPVGSRRWSPQHQQRRGAHLHGFPQL